MDVKLIIFHTPQTGIYRKRKVLVSHQVIVKQSINPLICVKHGFLLPAIGQTMSLLNSSSQSMINLFGQILLFFR